MDTVAKQNILASILKKYTEMPDRYGDMTTSLIISQERHRFLLAEGGKGLAYLPESGSAVTPASTKQTTASVCCCTLSALSSCRLGSRYFRFS